MKNKIFLLILCLPLLVGCAAKQEKKARRQIQATCESLMGCSEEEVALEFGVPQKVQEIGKLKVYQYYKSYGTRENATAYGDWSYGIGSKIAWEAYDKIEIFFRNGHVTSWKSSVKR